MKYKFLAASIRLSALFVLLGVTGCAEYHRRVLESTPVSGPEFTRTLAKEYETLGNTEQSIMYDERSANCYFLKAILAREGNFVRPTILGRQDIECEKVPELRLARERLMRALEFGAWEVAPKMSAHAQAHFDCWVEQQVEGWQLEDIASCRAEFYQSMVEVELMLMGGLNTVFPPNMVFFDFGEAYLNEEALQIIDHVTAVTRTPQYPDHILLVGRADRIGDAKHNTQLSEQRALAVKNELIRKGVPPHQITTKAVGETPGPKIDAHNRRVDILFLGGR